MFDHIAIESHRAMPDPHAAHALLTQKALEAGLEESAEDSNQEACEGGSDHEMSGSLFSNLGVVSRDCLS